MSGHYTLKDQLVIRGNDHIIDPDRYLISEDEPIHWWGRPIDTPRSIDSENRSHSSGPAA